MTRRALLPALLLASLTTAAQAHVGSPTVIFEGAAGPYPVRVIVRPPEVVPGLAEVSVRLLQGSATGVALQPIWWWAPKDGGAPPPDVAHPVQGEPAVFTGSLWLMTSGSYAVRVTVAGASGTGEALVPVAAFATQRRSMNRAFGFVLLALAALMYAGSVSIVRASVGEAVIAPGDAIGPRRRRSLVAAGIAAVLLGAALVGLWRWWDDVDAAFRNRLYQPPRLVTTARVAGNGRVLGLTIEGDPRRRSPLTPDHGKLMHLFLVREPSFDVFAHMHPAMVRGQETFEAPLAPIPAGRYRVFADVTHETGFAETLTSSVELPDPPSAAASAASDPDDSYFVPRELLGAQPYPASPSKLDGVELRQLPASGPLVAGRDVVLRFQLVTADGQPALPEPYMGMAGHAVVLRDDASVFVHLHPSGTVSMASQQRFATKVAIVAADHAAHASVKDPVIGFPYAFPREGRYRVFVQAKAGGLVRTHAFDVTVAPAS